MHWQSSDWWKIYVLKYWLMCRNNSTEKIQMTWVEFSWKNLSSFLAMCRVWHVKLYHFCLTYYSANSSRKDNVKTSKNPLLINTIISCTIMGQTSCHGRILSFPIVKLPRDIGISPKWFLWSFPIPSSGEVLLNHQRELHLFCICWSKYNKEFGCSSPCRKWPNFQGNGFFLTVL